MTDLTPKLNEVLKSHDARPISKPPLSLQKLEGFIREAYTINSHIAGLNAYLRAIRESYLSTTSRPTPKRSKVGLLTDRDREAIDATATQSLRELKKSLEKMTEVEKIRQDTQTTLLQKKHGRPLLGGLAKWAAGGAGHIKSMAQEEDDARANAINMHHEGVLLYLKEKLRECGGLQAGMMEKRLMRTVEKNKNILAKSKIADLGGFGDTVVPATFNVYLEKNGEGGNGQEEELSDEMIQMFEKDNQDLLKHQQSTLDQVKSAEKSLIEIAQLQNQLVENLNIQSAHIEQLVADSELTTENVGGGNKELKKAAERGSTAKYVYYAALSLSAFLVIWDLVI